MTVIQLRNLKKKKKTAYLAKNVFAVSFVEKLLISGREQITIFRDIHHWANWKRSQWLSKTNLSRCDRSKGFLLRCIKGISAKSHEFFLNRRYSWFMFMQLSHALYCLNKASKLLITFMKVFCGLKKIPPDLKVNKKYIGNFN